mgnify:CR=1 FL=1
MHSAFAWVCLVAPEIGGRRDLGRIWVGSGSDLGGRIWVGSGSIRVESGWELAVALHIKLGGTRSCAGPTWASRTQ